MPGASTASLAMTTMPSRIEFSKLSKVSVDRIVRMVREGAGRVLIDPKMPNFLLLKTGPIGLKEKSEFLKDRLAQLVS